MSNTQAVRVDQSFSNQDKHCKIIYTIIGCILGFFLIWLIILSVKKSLRAQQGERGPPGPMGPEGATGPIGATSNVEMKNAKVFYITKNTDFSKSTEVQPRSGFILGNGVKSDVTIKLPHFSVIGNGAMFYIFNQSPVYTLLVKAAKISGQNPAQMSFTTGGTEIKLMPRQFLTIVIMAQQYAVFNEEEKNNKPILHWVNSWNNCGGIPKKFSKLPSDEGFTVGPSLQTWGCQNYRKYMDIVQIGSTVKNANTLGKNPSDVGPGGIFVVENPNRKPINNQGKITIKSQGPVNIKAQGSLENRRSSPGILNRQGGSVNGRSSSDKSADTNRQRGLLNRRASSVILNTAINTNRQGGFANPRSRPKRKQMSAIRSHKKRHRRKKKKQLTEKQKKRKKWIQQRKKESRERRKRAQEKLRMRQMMRGNRRR